MARIPPLTRREVDEINLIRLDRHWSWRELAEDVDLPVTTVQSVIKGIAKHPVETTVFRLRKWLGRHRAKRARALTTARAAFERLEPVIPRGVEP